MNDKNTETTRTCDRCGKKFKVNKDEKVVVGQVPSRVSIKEFGGKQPRSYILCPTCTGFVVHFIEYKNH